MKKERRFEILSSFVFLNSLNTLKIALNFLYLNSSPPYFLKFMIFNQYT